MWVVYSPNTQIPTSESEMLFPKEEAQACSAAHWQVFAA